MQNTYPVAIIITLVSKLQVKIIFFLVIENKEWLHIDENFIEKLYGGYFGIYFMVLNTFIENYFSTNACSIT